MARALRVHHTETVNSDSQKKKAEKVEHTIRDPEKKVMSREELEPVITLVNAIESLGLEEFIEYIRSPWRLLWPNFVAWVARWFWALVGATIVVALIVWGLSQIISLPLIGKYIEPYAKTVQDEFNRYIQSTDYNPHFENIESLLDDIRDTLKPSTPLTLPQWQ